MVESSNKSLVRIIKKLLEENKKAWNAELKFALWVDKVSTKKSIGTSPFQLVYGTDAIFLASLGSPVMKYLQEQDIESNLPKSSSSILGTDEGANFESFLLDLTNKTMI